jgi:hypothetical protein
VRWEQGRAAVDGMMARGELERVPASRDHADQLVVQARGHFASAQTIMAVDPVGAYQLLYDAARKALSAVLENQGLRATSRGGHIAVFDAVMAQLHPPLGQVLRPFDRMRRRRNEAEYPRADRPTFTADEGTREVPKVAAILDAVDLLLDQMSPY